MRNSCRNPLHLKENILYNELKVRGFDVDVGVVPIAEKDKSGKVIRKQLEIDFVCNRGIKKYYIQSAYTLTVYDDNGILTLNFLDFLMNKDSLER